MKKYYFNRFINENDFAINQMNILAKRRGFHTLHGKIKQSLLKCYDELTDLEANFVSLDILINFGYYRVSKDKSIDDLWGKFYGDMKAANSPTIPDTEFAEWFWGNLAVGKAKLGLPPTMGWRQDIMINENKIMVKTNAKSNE